MISNIFPLINTQITSYNEPNYLLAKLLFVNGCMPAGNLVQCFTFTVYVFSGQILICYLFMFGAHQQKSVESQSENYAKSVY